MSSRAFALGVGRSALSFQRPTQTSRSLRIGAQLAAPTVEAAVPLTQVKLSTSDETIASWSGDLMLLPCWEAAENTTLALEGEASALDKELDGMLSDLIELSEFKGAAGTSAVTMLPRSASVRKVALVGLGKASDFNGKAAKKWGEALAATAKAEKTKVAAALLPSLPEGAPLSSAVLQSGLESMLLALSPDTRYKSAEDASTKPPPLTDLQLLGGADEAALSRASTVASGILLTRGLVSSPANYLTPTTMAACAGSLADTFPCLSLTVLEQEECEARGMGAYLGVSQGAAEPPKFIHLIYSPTTEVKRRVALVGKGLTFDSGGYNIKAGAGSMIEKMKFDMGGAGAVLGTARVIAGLAPPDVEVHFIIAACENMVSNEAMRPGDILTASNKKTIEVLNTDAEGRLTLADALVYAEGLGEMDAIVDIATLTGACIVALGPTYAGLWSSDEALASSLLASAAATDEPLWRMPLADEYKEQLKSSIADLANLGAPGGGGSITAALFLKEFVKETPWAHMDIAGPVWNEKAGGATGYAVRTLSRFVEQGGESVAE